jgi:DNA recombination protein RmuC
VLTTLLVLASAVIAAALVWLWAQARSAALAERQRLLAGQFVKAEADLAALRTHLLDLEAEKTRLATLLTAERDALQQAQERLTDTFKALAADALRSNNDEFLKRAGDTLVKPVAESLKDVRDKITELEKTRASAYGSLSEQLKSLALAQASR